MNDERWRKIDKILQAALDLEPCERPTLLDNACQGDEELRREVESLLAHEDSAERFIETSAMNVVARNLAEEDLSGQQIGHYQIIKPIGEGGMGKVYLAEDGKLSRRVAMKFLPEAFTADAERVRRFEQEARAASALNHPNIITIHEIGQHEGLHYIVTELIEGQTLRERLTKSRLTVKETIDIAAQVASALKVAHSAGIFHRDIKPENIMLREDGVVKVLDFGIAKLGREFVVSPSGGMHSGQESLPPEGGTTNLTSAGAILGTVSYMSPEQARGEEVDGRSDLFSLGAVMYEMAMSERLFPSATPAEVTEQLLRPQEPLSAAAKFSSKAKRLEPIIRKCLRRKREQRYQSAANLLNDLQRLKRQLEMAFVRRVVVALAIFTGLLIAAFGVVIPASIHEDWNETRMRDGHIAAVRRAIFSPDGRWLVSVSEDKRVIVWDFARRQQIKTLTDHQGFVTSVAFSPNGKWLATGSTDKKAIVWDARNFEKVAVLEDHQSDINSVVFSPDNEWLATTEVGITGTILWKTGQWMKAREFSDFGSGYNNVLFSPDGEFLMTGAWQLDIESGRIVADSRDKNYLGGKKAGWNWAAFSPDNKMAVLATAFGMVEFWALAQPGEIRNSRLLDSFPAHQDFGRSVAFSPDGRLVASGSDNVALWDAAKRKLLGRFEYDSIVWSVAFSPDGRWLVSTHGDGSMQVWDVAKRRRSVGFNGHGDAVRTVAVSTDGKWIASAGEDRSIVLWDLASGRKTMVFTEHQTRVTALAFSPDNQWLVSSDQNGVVICWNIVTGQLRWKTKSSTRPGLCIAISPDGQWLVTAEGVFESKTGRLLVGLTEELDEIAWSEGVAISSDGRLMASAGRSHGRLGLFLLDTKTWQIIGNQRTSGATQPVTVSFSPDNRKLVTGSIDGTVMLWNADPLRPIAPLGKHSARVKALAYLPNGNVVSVGDDKKFLLWDVERRRLLREIGEHGTPVYSVAVSPDGRQIVSGEQDKSVRLYTRQLSLWGKKLDESSWVLRLLRRFGLFH